MCGILGLVAPPNARPNATPQQVSAMRDRMTNRGPDAGGLTAHENVILAARSLKIIDPDNSEQPLWSPDKRFLLVYNGELYNDGELRQELTRDHGVEFRTNCDTETVLHAFATWGLECLNKLRGMFAFGIYDFKEQTLILARDPLGIKPLYFGMIGNNFVFGSSIPAILAHPEASAMPNFAAISAYLTTIRTTTGNDSMFAGISTLRPAQFATVRFVGDEATADIQGGEYWHEHGTTNHETSMDEAAGQVREAVIDSVGRHLRSDVPRALLLSGGLDSTILAAACQSLGVMSDLPTWCAGDTEDSGGDREFARLASDRFKTDHHDVVVDERMFVENWASLIDETGMPLSTPNETAILAIAREIKPRATVALSGEGADELFAGYALPLLSAVDQLRTSIPDHWPGDDAAQHQFHDELMEQYGSTDLGTPIDHYFRCNSWIDPGAKASVFQQDVLELIQGDALLVNEISQQYDRSSEQFDLWEQLLQVQRRINLTGLLARLDTATMAAGIEGRTPFADVKIAELAMTLPISCKMTFEEEIEEGGWSAAATVVAKKQVTTKAVLRKAFADAIPPVIVDRPKASFPLPFMQWMNGIAPVIRECELAKRIIHPQMLETIASDPATNWKMAWPIFNLALWGRRWWG